MSVPDRSVHLLCLTKEESSGVELPDLRRSHEECPADEEAHDGEREEGGLPADRVHEVDGAQRAE